MSSFIAYCNLGVSSKNQSSTSRLIIFLLFYLKGFMTLPFGIGLIDMHS